MREKRRQDLLSLDQTSVEPKPGENQDVWTMALILWQMHTHKPLFASMTMSQAAVAFMTRTLPPELDESIPPELREILEDCWLDKADARPSFSMLYDRIRALECSQSDVVAPRT